MCPTTLSKECLGEEEDGTFDSQMDQIHATKLKDNSLLGWGFQIGVYSIELAPRRGHYLPFCGHW